MMTPQRQVKDIEAIAEYREEIIDDANLRGSGRDCLPCKLTEYIGYSYR